jgi:hypothetical protein
MSLGDRGSMKILLAIAEYRDLAAVCAKMCAKILRHAKSSRTRCQEREWKAMS